MYIVSYDITDDKERKNVIKVLECYGERIQKSVWQCEISKFELSKLLTSLRSLKIETGNIQIWLTQSDVWKIGNEETIPKRAWAHFM